MRIPKLLTLRKQKWAATVKPKYLRGKVLNPNISDAVRYKNKLDKLILRMTKEVEIELKKLFRQDFSKAYFAQDASLSSQARILTNALLEKFNDMFASIAKPIAESMVDNADKASASSLHGSLKDLSGGLSIKTSSLSPEIIDVFNATTTENVNLIKSISSQYLDGVQQAVMRSITTGTGLQDLVPYLQKSKEISLKRAHRIALDQTRKAFNNVNKSRMQKLGIKEFEWLHSGGSNEPRKHHIELSGQIFSFDNLPFSEDNKRRIYPGSEINCRCRALPVIKFDEE